MNNINKLKEAFGEITRLCLDIPSVTLQDAVMSISAQMDDLKEGEDDTAAGLLSELMLHVNDLDQEEADEFQDILEEINEMADDITNEFF